VTRAAIPARQKCNYKMIRNKRYCTATTRKNASVLEGLTLEKGPWKAWKGKSSGEYVYEQ